jgi:hypothetical protein
MKLRRVLAIGVGLACVSACKGGSSDDDGAGGGNATGGSAGSGGSDAAAGTGGAAGAAPCSEDPASIAPGANCVLSVSGTVVDGTGKPVSGLSTSVCGSVCWYGESDATGAFTVAIGAHILPDQYSTLVHGRPTRTTFYWPLPPTAKDTVAIGELTTLDLPTTGSPLIVKTDKQGAPAQTVTDGDVTIDIPAGVQVKIDVEDLLFGADGKLFRAFLIPVDQRDKFVAPALGLESVYALTPFEAAIVAETSGDPALARLSVKNSTGLPAGTAVEFLELGSYLFPEFVKPAAFEVVASGKVSSDGTSIDMDAGQGVRYLTWVGVRKKP